MAGEAAQAKSSTRANAQSVLDAELEALGVLPGGSPEFRASVTGLARILYGEYGRRDCSLGRGDEKRLG